MTQSSAVRASEEESVNEKHLNYQDQVDFAHTESLDYSGLERPWYHYSYLRKLTFCVATITLSSTNTGYDGSMLNGLQVLDSWSSEMGNPSGSRLGALNNATGFGAIISFPISQWITDRYGRKPAIMLGNILMIIGGVLQGASTNYAFFLVVRLILGLGNGIVTVASPTLISEISYAPHRNICTSVYNVCWYVGAIIAA